MSQAILHPAAPGARPRSRAGAWLSALRVHQWSKNGLILVPLILAHAYANPSQLAESLLACLAFSLVSSATYLVNDLFDLDADRAHATKRRRPIAAGEIAPGLAAAVASGLLFVGLAGAAALSRAFFGVAVIYVALTLLYSLRLKREPLIDVLTIGGLFTLRIVAGMVVIGQPVSLWLSSFTLVLFTSLATAKRHAELVRAASAATGVGGRAYLPADIPLTVAFGMASAMTAVVVMLLYMALEAAGTGLYRQLSPLFLIPLVLAAWLARIWIRAHRGALQDDPVIFALKDKASWLHAAAVAGLWLFAVR
jgi:4-hydroxybenzoate polyprenyltransferase